MKKIIFLFSLICLLASCSGGGSKAKDVVKEYCEAYKAQQTDKATMLYPGSEKGMPQVQQVDTENLKVSKDNDKWVVEDGANHVFYVQKQDGKFIINDSRNVISWNSETESDIEVAKTLGMVKENSTDMERINAYTMLQDDSDLINFLKAKYPQAMVYDVSVENVTKKKEGGMGIYWLEIKATLKSGFAKPLGMLKVYFVSKDKNGNELTRDYALANLEANSRQTVEKMVDLSDFPNVENVEIEIEPFISSNLKSIRSVDLLRLYAPISASDYKEYMNRKK